jgi:hypothetical protein
MDCYAFDPMGGDKPLTTAIIFQIANELGKPHMHSALFAMSLTSLLG